MAHHRSISRLWLSVIGSSMFNQWSVVPQTSTLSTMTRNDHIADVSRAAMTVLKLTELCAEKWTRLGLYNGNKTTYHLHGLTIHVCHKDMYNDSVSYTESCTMTLCYWESCVTCLEQHSMKKQREQQEEVVCCVHVLTLNADDARPPQRTDVCHVDVIPRETTELEDILHHNDNLSTTFTSHRCTGHSTRNISPSCTALGQEVLAARCQAW